MCGFAGFAGYEESLWEERYLWGNLGKRMGKRLAHRGTEDGGTHVSRNCVLSHRRISVTDPILGGQPMMVRKDNFSYTIAFDGEIYNAAEVRGTLESKGWSFETGGDSEVVVKAYMEYGDDCPVLLNGQFSFIIDDERQRRVFLCRDRFGAKPLFYTFSQGRIVFASEIKALFEYPGVRPIVGKEGLSELFGLAPIRTPGCGVFKDIHELLPGYIGSYNHGGFKAEPYYTLTCHPFEDSYETAVIKVRELLLDSCNRQSAADAPLCSFLSGEPSSNIITALAANNLRLGGKQLSTYAFVPYADTDLAGMTEVCLDHKALHCPDKSLFYGLYDAVIARDLPAMAEVDSALLYFFREIKNKHSIALSGEGSDEIFCSPSFSSADTFPWSPEITLREALLHPELAHTLDVKSYVNHRYQEALLDTPMISGEGKEERTHRQMSFLNIRWFMGTMLERMDRCGMYSGLKIRTPYTDHRLVEYLMNTPWEYKCRNGIENALLRDAAKGVLPDELLHKRKALYPKPNNPAYEDMVKTKLKFILLDSLQPIHRVISKDSVKALLNANQDYGKLSTSHLMSHSQLLAYLVQVNYWLLRYNVSIDI